MITRRNMLASISFLAIPGLGKTMADEVPEKKQDGVEEPTAPELKKHKPDAKPSEMSSKDAQLNFLKSDSVDFKKLLPAPARINSDETKTEVQLLVHIQQVRTEAEVAGVEATAKLTLGAFTSIF